MLHFMDEPKFCGTACHTVMNPEWTTYQQSPHARVKCVDCHVGEGIDALVSSKLNGARQMLLASFNLYNTPIPTPVHQLRPARETCEKCHWPDKFYGNKMKTIIHYRQDSASTPYYTTLNLKIDTKKYAQKTGIHWHIARENEVRHIAMDEKRQEMIHIEVRRPDGTYKSFENKQAMRSHSRLGEIRKLDCVDCHNRATHIYKKPERAIDEHFTFGLLNRSLPYLKRAALDAVTKNYNHQQAALEGISNHLRGFYERLPINNPEDSMSLITSAITILQNIYTRNIHHRMKITWGTYPSHIGHERGRGCFRCHNQEMVDSEGKIISHDCTICHSILAFEEDEPFKYFKPADMNDKNYLMHDYLREEFFKSPQ